MLLAAALAACTAEGLSPSAPGELAQPMATGELAAGRYTHPAFTPRIEITVPDGWQSFHLSRNFFDVAIVGDDPEAAPTLVSFVNPDSYLTPDGGELHPATPEEAIAAIATHESLTLSDPRAVEIDGFAGMEVDVAASVDNTHLMRTEEGDIGIGPTNSVRFAFIQVGEEVLVIGILGPEGGMVEAAAATQAVRESIEIGDS
jgi:hypothetical protein